MFTSLSSKQAADLWPEGKPKLRWWRLRFNKCPACGKDMDSIKRNGLFLCGARCGFTIGEKKFETIATDRWKGDVEKRASHNEQQ